jgi:hypothetical protein
LSSFLKVRISLDLLPITVTVTLVMPLPVLPASPARLLRDAANGFRSDPQRVRRGAGTMTA